MTLLAGVVQSSAHFGWRALTRSSVPLSAFGSWYLSKRAGTLQRDRCRPQSVDNDNERSPMAQTCKIMAPVFFLLIHRKVTCQQLLIGGHQTAH